MNDMDKKEDENLGSFYMGRSSRNQPQPRRLLPRGVLTAAALLAFAGILWYAYPRGPEKYSDIDVPVVKAETAPIKVEPADPGGMEVPNQDSTVYESLAKTAPDAAEKILPAPEAPVDVDEALKQEAATPPAPAEESKSTAAAAEGPGLQPEDVTEKPAVSDVAESAPPAKAETKKEEAPEPAVPAAAPAAVAGDAAKKAEAAEKAEAIGDVYIQLGSYRDTAGAKKDWERIRKKFPDLLSPLSMRTQKVDLPAKGTYYRLQAGKVTQARAGEICSALKKAGSVGCIVVKN